MKNNLLFWISENVSRWRQAVEEDRTPHAVMLTGPPGSGKRVFADWIAKGRLVSDNGDPEAGDPLEHADLHRLQLEDEKSSIGIDQVRAMIHGLSLTSYEGRGKVCIVDPANLMTSAAANSLLKTLEEPPGDALIILVADRLGRLPATIFSRCQRINLQIPDRAAALAWLDSARPGRDWQTALESAGGGPLLALRREEDLETLESMDKGFSALGQGRESAIRLAAAWQKLDPQLVLGWLANRVQGLIRGQIAGEKWGTGLGLENSRVSRIDSEKLFCYLDIINQLRASPKGSFNLQLALERLLTDWAQGLRNVSPRKHGGGLDYLLRDQ